MVISDHPKRHNLELGFIFHEYEYETVLSKHYEIFVLTLPS